MAELRSEGFDVIGDVHGCARELVELLELMDYKLVDGVWKHPTRQAVFVGDFIDRGSNQLDSVAIPRAMVEAGSAFAVLGNHEFNAVSYATKNDAGDWCREHSTKNRSQSEAFLAAAPLGSQTHTDIINWFMSLPLWLDLGGLTVVHACWDESSMDAISSTLSTAGGLTRELVLRANEKRTPEYEAIEVLLKGPEADLGGYSYTDMGGHTRKAGRFNWWDRHAKTLRDGVRLPKEWLLVDGDGNPCVDLPDTPLEDSLTSMTPSDLSSSPVIFGHYWFTTGDNNKDLQVINRKAACVDFSAVNGGSLVAYRWSGEAELTSESLVATAR